MISDHQLSTSSEVPLAPTVEVQHLSKSFGGVHALNDVYLTILPGEIHGLLGENGSGKSTLIKCLAGYHTPDAGRLIVAGRQIPLPVPPNIVRELGFEFVHQDLGLVPSLSVMENLCIADLATSKYRWHIPWRKIRRATREIFARYGIRLDPDMRVAELNPIQRALLAIVRAVEGMRHTLGEGSDHRGLLVLDEPTVFLPQDETEQLFAILKEIVATGASVLFVSHDLDEAQEISDRITVLRDGKVVATVVSTEVDKADLVELIIGRRLDVIDFRQRASLEQHAKSSVTHLIDEMVRDISFEVRRGEVLGITGLAGSGFEEVPYLLYGARKVIGGTLSLGDKAYDLRELTPSKAMEAGIALIPADRPRDGAVLSLTITDNVTLPTLDSFFQGLRLRRGQMVRRTSELMNEFDVRPRAPELPCSSLSGGNQQKAILAKWLQISPRLLLLHEPTQGVDIGARQHIFRLIREAAAEGLPIICASADYEQLAVICDRVLVLGRGRIVQELTKEELTKERITEQCLNSTTGGTRA